MIALRERTDGVVVPIRLQPGARKTGVIGEHAGALKVAVIAPPENGRANAALVELLRDLFQVQRSQIELISGGASRNKSVLLREAHAERIAQRLAEIIGS